MKTKITAFRLNQEFGERFFYGCVGSVLEV